MFRNSPIALSLVLLAGALSAHAQTTRQGSDGLARLQAVVQQLTSERAALQADNSKLEARVGELETQLAAAQKAHSSLASELVRTQASERLATTNGDALNNRLEDARTRMQELIARFRETASNLQQTEQERGALKQQLAASTQQLDLCSKRNVALYEVGNEVLDRYESKGLWTVLRQKEPFTQLKRAQIENLSEDYRARMDDAQYNAPGAAPAAGADHGDGA
jgi:cell division septum initiation protein DivIVA